MNCWMYLEYLEVTIPMTISKLFAKLRKQNKGQYLMLGFCIFLSVLLITSFALMYYSPTVQNFLPEGGDTRKLASLLIAVTAVGCTIFTLYASSLFFRYKSQEYGIFLALGTPKSALKPLLFRELFTVMGTAVLLGLFCALPLSFGIWKVFQLFLVSAEEMEYRFGFLGFILGVGFSAVLALLLLFAGLKFIKKSNIMDILHARHKTELVQDIPPWIGNAGVILIVVGIVSGSAIPSISASVFLYNMPPAINLLYLLSLAGIYMFLLSVVAQTRAGRKKEKYYGNLVSISMMRFTAKATTKNMCVIALLLFCAISAAFYGMVYSDSTGIVGSENKKNFSLHFPAAEQQVSENDIYGLADEYGMDITEYNEMDAANLVISYKYRDLTDDRNYITIEEDDAKLALFFSADDFSKLSGKEIAVEDGTYKIVTTTNYKERIWDFMDGLYAIKNPDSGYTAELTYAGSTEFDTFAAMSSPFAYILSDADYGAATASLGSAYMEHVIAFDVDDPQASYPFAKALEKQYVQNATDLSNHSYYYDAWESKLAAQQGIPYGNDYSIDLSIENTQLMDDWKYAPNFTIITQEEFMHLICVYVMLCLYIFVITLSTVAIMSYVRSVSVATDNKELFLSLSKLGAGHAYRSKVLQGQLAKIFHYPVITGSALGSLFALCMSLFNDGRLTANEYRYLGYLLILIFGLCLILYVVYRMARKKARQIVGL